MSLPHPPFFFLSFQISVPFSPLKPIPESRRTFILDFSPFPFVSSLIVAFDVGSLMSDRPASLRFPFPDAE